MHIVTVYNCISCANSYLLLLSTLHVTPDPAAKDQAFEHEAVCERACPTPAIALERQL